MKVSFATFLHDEILSCSISLQIVEKHVEYLKEKAMIYCLRTRLLIDLYDLPMMFMKSFHDTRSHKKYMFGGIRVMIYGVLAYWPCGIGIWSVEPVGHVA